MGATPYVAGTRPSNDYGRFGRRVTKLGDSHRGKMALTGRVYLLYSVVYILHSQNGSSSFQACHIKSTHLTWGGGVLFKCTLYIFVDLGLNHLHMVN